MWLSKSSNEHACRRRVGATLLARCPGLARAPVQELAGFERIQLAPGESRDVAFTIRPEQLTMLDAELRPVIEPGAFRIMVGRSSKDIRLRGELVVR
jgi:hypothetical protein